MQTPSTSEQAQPIDNRKLGKKNIAYPSIRLKIVNFTCRSVNLVLKNGNRTLEDVNLMPIIGNQNTLENF